MTKCEAVGCQKITQFNKTKNRYCIMHLARIRRHGNLNLKKMSGTHGLEKLPHEIVDDFIISNLQSMKDVELAEQLQKMGYGHATKWTVGFRRRKLGKRKYLRGEIKKHKAWVRTQAIKKYGEACEICGYSMTVDTHHIIPKYSGGPHEIDNLMVLCPNCHALITRRKMILNSRNDIEKLKVEMSKIIKSYYNII